jgi:hypothetical protein
MNQFELLQMEAKLIELRLEAAQDERAREVTRGRPSTLRSRVGALLVRLGLWLSPQAAPAAADKRAPGLASR